MTILQSPLQCFHVQALFYLLIITLNYLDQMTQMMMAQRGYQANLSVIDRATQAYQAALQLGKH